jgi:hypothetical protein
MLIEQKDIIVYEWNAIKASNDVLSQKMAQLLRACREMEVHLNA